MVNNIETGLPNGDPSHAAFAARQSAKAVGRSGEDANGLDEEHPGATDAQSQKRLALKKQAVGEQ